jgi:hypothetical protein
MAESAPFHETRQQKAAGKIADAEQRIRELDRLRASYRAFVADRSNPLRKRLRMRLADRSARAAQASARVEIRLVTPDLEEGPNFTERMAAQSQEEFSLAEESRRRAHAQVVESPVAARRPGLSATIDFVFGWSILGVVLAADYLVFRSFDVQYFRWYVENGALINLAFSFISLAVVLDAYRDLISSNPLRYLSSCLALWLHVLLAWGETINSDDEGAEPTWLLPALFDLLVSLVVYVCMVLVVTGWMLVVAPVQHIVYAVLGAPARNAIRSTKTSSWDPDKDRTTVAAPVGQTRTGFTLGYRAKPVTLTAALASVVFWLISVLS